MPKRIDYTGKKYGYLTLLHFLRGRGTGKHAIWLARCDCGATKEVEGRLVARGSVKTCGKCQLHRDLITKAASTPRPSRGMSRPLRQAYSRYVSSAVKRNIGWELTPEECMELFRKNCAYCDAPANRGAKHGNGIDRMDSALAYTHENTVSCCTECNMMKRSMSVLQFLSKATAICKKLQPLKQALDSQNVPW